jgi:sugar/nucleoside kinase (ribokinase family)
LDYIGVVDRFVESDVKKEFAQFSTQGGGAAATAMVTLSRWGVDTAFIGKVGSDQRGDEIERTLAEEGIDTSAMVHQPDAVSQMSFIVVESTSGRKHTYMTVGSVEPLSRDEVDPDVLDGVDLLLCDSTHSEVELSLMKAANERGITVILDASEMTSDIRETVAHSDYLVASERFASQFAGVGELESLCHALLERGPSVAIVTLGNEGSVAMSVDDRELIRADAYEDVRVIDTTGAGDVYHGAIIYGVLQGWELAKTVRFANTAAGLSCTGIGGRSAIPAVDDVLAAM